VEQRRVFSPSIVPSGEDTVYIVEDDFGPIGRAWRETESASSGRVATLNDLYSGQFNDPVRVVAFNAKEGWSRDVSAELAAELQRRADLEGRQLEGAIARFVQDYTRPGRQLSLRLA
jgi:hypothetical protein